MLLPLETESAGLHPEPTSEVLSPGTPRGWGGSGRLLLLSPAQLCCRLLHDTGTILRFCMNDITSNVVEHKETPGAGEHTGVQVMRTALHNWRAPIYA